MRCELCASETVHGQWAGERWVPICSTCLDYFGPKPEDEIDDSAGDRDRAHATWEQENPHG